MTAQPAGPVEWSPDPIRQRRADHLLEDVLSLPGGAPRAELRDGVMIAVPAPALGHQAIAVEIVSPGTKRRDRLEKPSEDAALDIPHFRRIEQGPLHVHAYDLVNGRYEPAGDSDTELVLSAPFEIKLPIRDITP